MGENNTAQAISFKKAKQMVEFASWAKKLVENLMIFLTKGKYDLLNAMAVHNWEKIGIVGFERKKKLVQHFNNLQFKTTFVWHIRVP